MRFRIIPVVLCWSLSIFAADSRRPNSDDALAALFSNLDLEAARKQAELVLQRDPQDSVALFVRMEVAELNLQTKVVMDSALRLCHTQSPANVLELASARILRHAGNTQAFRTVIDRVKAAQQENACASNLRLALVAAAADGDSALDLSQSATAAGLLTRWQIAGPFGRYSNADFDRQWEPETDRFSHAYYGKLQTEEFLFPDGVVSLPDYLSAPGIFYAASDIELAKPENAALEIFSPGPYAIFLDGKLLLAHDSRYVAASSTDSVVLKINPGKHRVMIKFTADAAPFRVAIHPEGRDAALQHLRSGGPVSDQTGQPQSRKTLALPFPAPLNHYIAGLNAYFREDFLALQHLLDSDPNRSAQYLRALLYSATDGLSLRAQTAWRALLPTALAQVKLAGVQSSAKISEMAGALPDSEAVQQAAFEILHDEDSLQRLITLHPSCSHLAEAFKFFSSSGELEKAPKSEKQLAQCGTESLRYSEVLSAAGRHAEAADYLEKLLTGNPLNRAARRMLIQELVLGGRDQEAQQQAAKLHAIAPNSATFARLVTAPYEVLDSRSGRASGFTQQNQFYVPFRRSGLKINQQTAQRHFSGGPSVVLLNDKVMSFSAGGAVSVYTHRITRLLNKDGISRFGEVSIPRGADLLDLRTIKPGGESVEPEMPLQKLTISMPALEPGDSIEEEFVAHYADWDEAPDDAAEFTFGSFIAPILSSRLVVIAPEDFPIQVSQKNANTPHVDHVQGDLIHIWEQNDIAQTAWEPDLPSENQLPSVAIGPAENSSERARDELIAATRIGVRVQEVAETFRESTQTDYEKGQRLYRFVTGKILSAEAEWSANSAEETLLNWEGSRTAALLALARSIGLKADLLLAHPIGRHCQSSPGSNCYTQPLVRFWFANGKIVDVDAESLDLPFGAIPAALDHQDALLVPFDYKSGELHVALTPSAGDEQSVAEAALSLDEGGSLTVDLRIRLGMARGQQIRALLRRSNERERQIFFDQLAIRIFPTATGATGSAAHENDPEEPPELTLHCYVPQVINADGPWQLDQLVPALGLRDLYAKSATRNFPLYIDSLLFESTSFHLHLPPDFHVRSLPSDFTTHTEFGNYSAQFSAEGRQITIHREFRIPIQIVAQQKYEAFAEFARQIDEAEQGRILLAVGQLRRN